MEKLNKHLVIGISVAGVVGALGVYAYMSSGSKKNYKRVGTVSKLFLHPVKSFSAIEVQEGELTDRGFLSCGIYDRSFMLVDENDHFLTARKCPKMILIKPSFSDDKKSLILSAEGQDDISIPLQQNGKVVSSSVWGLDVKGQDCGDDVAKWLSDFLEGTYRMVFYSTGLPGKNLAKESTFGKHMKENEVALYHDFGQYHLLSEASVEDLNSRIEEKVSVKTFRPNIFVKDCSPYAEDFWKFVKVGEEAEMRFIVFCGRCKMVTLNHTLGDFISMDPLKTLKEYRQCYGFVEDRKYYATSPIFGTQLNLEKRGKIKVGDPVFASFQYQEHAGDEVKN
ncbi:Mitochondrial amidoxime reducing component 2 [Holothuria leucospilota]|uniref:Mitochondrial amidoxime reducing component 2 n=1 Tax=Holothuria leucospilota TaxID=206669 RepID=A0A9Q1CJG4_HOLLE|nr:Mitochondrial amidoxime reducing component 2 [Holothuria leucospilota]